MKLFGVIKNVWVVIGIAVASDICAMQLIRYEDSAQQFINQFPSMTFASACTDWDDLSPVAKQQIEKVEEKRNKGKSNLIFDIVRYLPHEVCSLIAQKCYDNSCNHNQTKINFLSTAPIKNIFCDIFISNTPFSKLQANIYIKKIKENNTIDDVTLFKLAEPITVLNRHCENNNKILSLEVVRSLEAIISEMADQGKNLVGVDIKLNWYYAYTLENSISAFNKGFCYNYGSVGRHTVLMKILSSMMMSCLLSRLVELYFCHKYIDQEIILQNEVSRELNQFISQSAYAELLSGSLRLIKDPMKHSVFDQLKIVLPSFLPIPILYQHHPEDPDKIIISVMRGFFSSLVCVGLNCFSYDNISNRVLFIGSAVCASLMAVYIIICTMKQMWQMRQLKSKTISWDKISNLLQKHDDGQIVIQ